MVPSQPEAALALPARVGVTVMPEWFDCEGVDAVLDRVQRLGATAVATSPYVLEPAAEGEGGREPPVDAGAGRVRPLDRPLWGRHELWVRTAPAFAHDMRRYEGLRYKPSPPDALTHRRADLLDRVVGACNARGIAVFMQIMAASPPGYRVQFSGARAQDECLSADGKPHHGRVDRNASLASTEVARYAGALAAEIAERYPGVAGIRLDWPEYPPYDLRSALFDFNPAMQDVMRRQGHDPALVAQTVLAWTQELRSSVHDAAQRRNARAAFERDPWRQLLDSGGPLAPLFAAKREAALELLRTVRAALDAVPGSRRRLEPQAFPPPFHTVSGFPLASLAGLADAVGIKLYTMHWPMIARFWARDIVGADHPAIDDVAAGVAQAFGFVDDDTDGRRLRYPEPDEPHPVSASAQTAKLEAARVQAGAVAVMAFAHSYGPLRDVVERCALAASTRLPLWINRYGYLSDAKIEALAPVLRRCRDGAT